MSFNFTNNRQRLLLAVLTIHGLKIANNKEKLLFWNNLGQNGRFWYLQFAIISAPNKRKMRHLMLINLTPELPTSSEKGSQSLRSTEIGKKMSTVQVWLSAPSKLAPI